MNIGFMGRSALLLDTIKKVSRLKNHKISFICTSKSEHYYECSENDFKSLANNLSVPFFLTPNVEDLINESSVNETDVVLSVNFVNLISEDFLKIIKSGVINAHCGDLPRYKGNATANWAILNNEDSVALSFHEMTGELDAGPIYLKKEFFLNSETYISDIYKWMSSEVPNGFLEVLILIINKKKPTKQENIRSLRTFPRKPHDGKIDWSKGVEEIHRLIRSSSRPFSGAYSYLNGNLEDKIYIHKANLIKLDQDIYAINGQIIEKINGSFRVASRNEAIEIVEFNLNGLNQKESLQKITASSRNRLV